MPFFSFTLWLYAFGVLMQIMTFRTRPVWVSLWFWGHVHQGWKQKKGKRKDTTTRKMTSNDKKCHLLSFACDEVGTKQLSKLNKGNYITIGKAIEPLVSNSFQCSRKYMLQIASFISYTRKHQGGHPYQWCHRREWWVAFSHCCIVMPPWFLCCIYCCSLFDANPA